MSPCIYASCSERAACPASYEYCAFVFIVQYVISACLSAADTVNFACLPLYSENKFQVILVTAGLLLLYIRGYDKKS